MSPPIKKWAFPMVRPGLACELLCSSSVSSVWRWESFSLMLLDGAWTLTTSILSHPGQEHTNVCAVLACPLA